MTNKETLGQRIWRLREASGLTAAQLGELTGLRTQTVNQLETGAIRLVGGYLESLAKALEVTEDYILNGDSPQEEERRRIAEFARPELRVDSLVSEFVEFATSRSFRNRYLSQHDLSALLAQFRITHEFQEDMRQFGLGSDNG